VLQNEKRQSVRNEMDSAGARRVGKQLQLVGKSEKFGKQFREVMRQVWGPAQNAVYADVDGNIGYVMAARTDPEEGAWRNSWPGDTDEYEWTGYIPFDQLPKVLIQRVD